MEKIIKSEFYEVWFSDGKTFWDYDLHEVMNFIRYYRPVHKKMSCILMWRCDFVNSVVCPVLRQHELKFNFDLPAWMQEG